MSEYICVNCGKDLGPGVATIFRGKNCPNCGVPWESKDGRRSSTSPGTDDTLAKTPAGTSTADADRTPVGGASR